MSTLQIPITLIPGDGSGPELVEAARRCVDAAGAEIKGEIRQAGADQIDEHGTPLPPDTLRSIETNRVALKGPLTTPIAAGFRSINVELRKKFDLYACLRPCRLFRGVQSRFDNIDIIIIRENTEDLYCGVEFEADQPSGGAVIEAINANSSSKVSPESAISIKAFTGGAVRRIIEFAFKYAIRHGRKKVTAATKANIMKATDGLFFNQAAAIACNYPQIAFEQILVDNLCMQLVVRPQEFDVLVMPNLRSIASTASSRASRMVRKKSASVILVRDSCV